MVALTTSLFFMHNGQLLALGLEDGKPIVLDPQKMPPVQYTAAFAFGAEAISKRRFNTPLKSYKFKQVAPSLLTESILDDVKEVKVLEKDNNAQVALSFNADKVALDIDNIFKDTSIYINAAASVIDGATYLAPNKENFVILSELNGQIYAFKVNQHKLIDFRVIPTENWAEEAVLTLRSLLTEESTRIVNFGVTIPPALHEEALKGYLPQNLSNDYALAYGLLCALEDGEIALKKPAASPELIRKRYKFYRHSLKTLAASFIVGLVLAGLLFIQNSQLQKTFTTFEAKKDQLFNEALPNTPQVAPTLQLEQRLRELQVAGGFQSEYDQGLLGHLQMLLDALSAESDVRVNNISIKNDKISFKAEVNKLSDTDKLKATLQQHFVTAKLRMSGVQVSKNSVQLKMDIEL